MTVTTRKLSFAEYLTYDDGSGNRYELVNGDLVPMGIETGLHGAIAEFLTDQFKAAATQAAPLDSKGYSHWRSVSLQYSVGYCPHS
jgi:Uma2 family endonuclease